jgi:hypothetical protein
METKVCSKCNIQKKLDEFNKCSRVKNGRKSECRDCQKIYSKKYRIVNKEKIKEYNKKWNVTNQNYYFDYFKNYYEVNYEREKNRKNEWRKNNPDYAKQYQKKRKKEDVLFNLICSMRNQVNRIVKSDNSRTTDIIGCSPQELKEHLEKQFVSGMTWENRNEWHIDHIIPLSLAQTEDELYKLCHYTNLQPLWAEENLKKSNKIIV